MRLTDKAIEELIREIATEETLKLVQKLKNKTNVSEFKLADNLKTTVNHVRNMLYKLNNYNLVSFTRKKDKKKGWYIYYWTFNPIRAKELLFSIKRKKLIQLKSELERETSTTFFGCPDKCVRFNLNIAMEHNFRCPECNQLLKEENNTRKIENIKKAIEEIEKGLTEKISRPPRPPKLKKSRKPKKPLKILKKPKRPKKLKKSKKQLKKLKKLKKKAKKLRPKKKPAKRKARKITAKKIKKRRKIKKIKKLKKQKRKK